LSVLAATRQTVTEERKAKIWEEIAFILEVELQKSVYNLLSERTNALLAKDVN